MSTDAALPDPPDPDALRAVGIRDDEHFTTDTETPWWRVHRTLGPYVLNWSQFRRYGPVLRFDPHPEPRGDHPGHGVWYGAATPDAALAEAFQFDRTIDRSRDVPYLTGLAFTRPLELLDLAHGSVGRVGNPRRRDVRDIHCAARNHAALGAGHRRRISQP